MPKTTANQERVRHYLRSGGLRVGDRLPGERALAGTLGLGRSALRGVMETLEDEGILMRRPQSGTFLTAVPLPARCSAHLALIAPLHKTDDPGRAAEPSWLRPVITAFERTVVPAGGQVMLLDQSARPAEDGAASVLVREAAVQGAQTIILLHPLGTRAQISRALALAHDLGLHPIIVSPRTFLGLASRVYFDSGWGSYLATRHLLTYGHQRIGFVGGSPDLEWVQERLVAYRGALEAADVPTDERWVWLPPCGEKPAAASDGAKALRAWISLPQDARPTGVVAANDVLALGLLDAAHRLGLSIPKDLSVIGFDNDPSALRAGLTTIARPTEALGEALGRVALERLNAGTDAQAVTVRLRPTLIERQSVGPPPL